MAKIFCNYEHCKLIKCPEKWSYYKELSDVTLTIFKSEKKHLDKKFFHFSSLHSSKIKKIWTEQKHINNNMYIFIETQHSLYVFEQDRNNIWN